MFEKVKGAIQGIPRKAAYPAALVAASVMYAVPAYASGAGGGVDAFDPSDALLSGFTQTANSILATMTACLPVVMSIMSAYICIRFGLRFFMRFVK